MAQTTVYLLFKEYVDASTGPTRPYIHGVDISVGDEDRLNEEINPIIQILSFFIYEHKTVLYDPDNLNQLFYQTEVIPNIYPGLSKPTKENRRKVSLRRLTEFLLFLPRKTCNGYLGLVIFRLLPFAPLSLIAGADPQASS